MDAIILVGGKSSRFWPLNYSHKALMRYLGKPLIIHTLEALALLKEVKRVAIVYGEENLKEVVEEYKKDHKLPEVGFARQEEAKGMWEAIWKGYQRLNEPGEVLVLSPHHYQEEILKKVIKAPGENVLAGSYREDASLYGRATLGHDGNTVIKFEEKPKDNKPGYVVTSIYKLSSEFIDFMVKSEEKLGEKWGEYILEGAFDAYAKTGKIKFVELKKMPPSYKYPWHSLEIMKDLLQRKVKKQEIKGKVAETARIIGPVIVEEGAVVDEYAVIKGPAYIGQGSFVGAYTFLRQSDIEAGVLTGSRSEIARSLLQDGVHLHATFVGDSVLGCCTKVGYGTVFANRRLDRKDILVEVKGKKVSAGNGFGAAVGRDVAIGVNVSVMPGTLIGSGAKIWPNTLIKGRIGEGEVVRK